MKVALFFFMVGVFGVSCCGKGNGISSDMPKHSTLMKHPGPCRMYSVRDEMEGEQEHSNLSTDSLDKLFSVCDSSVFDTKFVYNSDGNISKRIQKNNDTTTRTTFFYDVSNFLVKEISMASNGKYSTTEIKEFLNGENGKPISIKVTRKTRTQTSIDEVRISYPVPGTTVTVADISGKKLKTSVVEQKDKNGKILSEKTSYEGYEGITFPSSRKKYFYDKNGNLKSVEKYYLESEMPVTKYVYTLDDFGNTILTTQFVGDNRCPVRIKQNYDCWK